MRVPKVYLETSVFNFYFADDAPDKRQDTIKLFEEIREGKYEPYTSSYVFQELLLAKEPKKSKMVGLMEPFNITLQPANGEAERLADIYVAEKIIPEKYFTDGVHIAMATVNDLDFIVSFNFQHIVKRKTIILTEVINAREGYKRIGIHSPTEVIESDE
jgi:predicted nucleic acid-binding protein